MTSTAMNNYINLAELTTDEFEEFNIYNIIICREYRNCINITLSANLNGDRLNSMFSKAIDNIKREFKDALIVYIGYSIDKIIHNENSNSNENTQYSYDVYFIMLPTSFLLKFKEIEVYDFVLYIGNYDNTQKVEISKETPPDTNIGYLNKEGKNAPYKSPIISIKN
jgi:hypothetical protein